MILRNVKKSYLNGFLTLFFLILCLNMQTILSVNQNESNYNYYDDDYDEDSDDDYDEDSDDDSGENRFMSTTVTIDPAEPINSKLYDERESEPPGLGQATLKKLISGPDYNKSVQKMSESEFSFPTTVQFQTVPLEYSLKTFLEPPKETSEFDKYQVSLSTMQIRQHGVTTTDDGLVSLESKDNLEPGKTYQVVVKTVSGKVTSWPATADVTLKPLPVNNLEIEEDSNGIITIVWSPDSQSTQDEYRISYHEVDGSTNGDSNSINTESTRYTIENLLPGRNYTITVQAISKKMESNETTIYLTTRPSAPIIEDLKSIREGLNISWKSDVNSKQEQYEVTYTRNDTAETETVLTKDTRLVFKNLYPGAGYIVKVFAISNELKSESHEYFQAVYPNPPRNMKIKKVTSNSVLVHWFPPEKSIITEYSIQYRTESDDQWVRLPSVNSLEAYITDMTPGEKYTIKVNTVSYGVESPNPQQLSKSVPPNTVANVVHLVDPNNITLGWSRPEGRVESYIISWWLSGITNHIHSRNISELNVSPTKHNEELEKESPHVLVLIDNLLSGFEYHFQIQVTSYNLISEDTIFIVRTMPIIQSDIKKIVGFDEDKNSITLTYTSTPRDEKVTFDHYRFSIDDTNIPFKEKLADDDDHNVVFSGLIPGHLYNIKMWTVSGGVLSNPIQRLDRLHPESITTLKASKITDTKITLAWDKPQGEYDTFEVQYLNDNLNNKNITTELSITIDNLKPYRNFTFTVVVRSGTEADISKVSAPVSAQFTTLESFPGKILNFTAIDIRPAEITFEWNLPIHEHNGVIQAYKISYGLEYEVHVKTENFSPRVQQGTIRSLTAGSFYWFKIQAKTAVGYGPVTIWKQEMPIWAPPKPESQIVPTEVHRSLSTIEIRFSKNYFSDINGVVMMYTIIVAEDDSENSSELKIPNWHDVQSYSIWPPYQAVEPYYPFKNSSANVEDFIIGDENCNKNRRKRYCNGPLKSGSTYRVKIRAFSAPDKFTDTDYSLPIKTEPNRKGKLIIRFRNETSLLVLWYPAKSSEISTNYKFSIDPPEAINSVLSVKKEVESPGPVKVVFKDLYPGRAYNISVQEISKDEISLLTNSQSRTIPLQPLTVTFDQSSITEFSFKALWEPPFGISEFDKYQVYLNKAQYNKKEIVKANGSPVLEFKDNLKPGETYQVAVKTVSGKVASLPATANVTLKPLPVNNLEVEDNSNGIITIVWSPDSQSTQDEYRISYHEADGSLNGDSSSINTESTRYTLENLLPEMSYEISVQAISKGMKSNRTIISVMRDDSPF